MKHARVCGICGVSCTDHTIVSALRTRHELLLHGDDAFECPSKRRGTRLMSPSVFLALPDTVSDAFRNILAEIIMGPQHAPSRSVSVHYWALLSLTAPKPHLNVHFSRPIVILLIFLAVCLCDITITGPACDLPRCPIRFAAPYHSGLILQTSPTRAWRRLWMSLQTHTTICKSIKPRGPHPPVLRT